MSVDLEDSLDYDPFEYGQTGGDLGIDEDPERWDWPDATPEVEETVVDRISRQEPATKVPHLELGDTLVKKFPVDGQSKAVPVPPPGPPGGAGPGPGNGNWSDSCNMQGHNQADISAATTDNILWVRKVTIMPRISRIGKYRPAF